jgi:hypothetical protein
MGIHADVVVALWDGVSRGTKHMIDVGRQLGKPVTVVTVPAIDNPNPKYNGKKS